MISGQGRVTLLFASEMTSFNKGMPLKAYDSTFLVSSILAKMPALTDKEEGEVAYIFVMRL